MILPIIVAMMFFIENTLQASLAPRCHPYSNRDIICHPSSTEILGMPQQINNGRFEMVATQWRLPQLSPSRRRLLRHHVRKLKFEDLKKKFTEENLPMLIMEATRVAFAAIKKKADEFK